MERATPPIPIRRGMQMLCWMQRPGKEALQKVLEPLPAVQKEALLQLPNPRGVPLAVVEPIFQLFSRIHHSWLPPLCSTLPESLREQALQAVASCRTQSWEDLERKTSSLSTQFWLSWVWQRLCAPEWLPDALLPQDEELEPLLVASKRELVAWIDLLGTLDLVPTVKRSVDARHLRIWEAALSEEQTRFVSFLMRQPAWPGTTVLPMPSDETPQAANRLLHERGCARLAFAALHVHSSWVWRLAHTLDRGRGGLLLQIAQEAMSSGINPEVTASARRAVLAILQHQKGMQQPTTEQKGGGS